MKNEEFELTGIEKRKAEAELFQRNKTICLQNDEISRLTSDYNSIHEQIENSLIHNQQVDQIYKNKIYRLRRKISSISSEFSVQKTKTMTQFSNQITEMINQHALKLNQIKESYRIKISQSSEPEIYIEKDPEILAISKSIKETREQINKTMEEQIRNRKESINKRLNNYTTQLELLHQKEKDINVLIFEEKKKLQEAKAFTMLRQCDAEATIQSKEKGLQTNQSKAEEKLLLFRASALNSENSLREDFQHEIQNIQSQIRDQTQKSLQLQKSIREIKIDEKGELKKAQKQLNDLSEKHIQAKEEEEKNIQNEIQQIIREKNYQQECRFAISEHEDRLKFLKEEHNALKEEIKRIDFMIYGRNGKFQKTL